MKEPSPFRQFSAQQAQNLRRGAWGTVVCVAALNLLVGQPDRWVWIGAFAALTAGLGPLSRLHAPASAWLHFLSAFAVIALAVSDPSGPARGLDPALVYATVSTPILLSVVVFFGLPGAAIASAASVALMATVHQTRYLAFAGFQIVATALFNAVIHNIIRQLEAARRSLEKAAMVDVLTGLENRRALEQGFPRYTALAARRGVGLVMTSWDLNDLKRINDRHGHAAGDDFLRAFAEVLRGTARADDAFFRVGGDEFVGLHLDCEDGSDLIGRVRAGFPNVAAGWTTVTGSLDDALREADEMMYAHKADLKFDGKRTQVLV